MWTLRVSFYQHLFPPIYQCFNVSTIIYFWNTDGKKSLVGVSYRVGVCDGSNLKTQRGCLVTVLYENHCIWNSFNSWDTIVWVKTVPCFWRYYHIIKHTLWLSWETILMPWVYLSSMCSAPLFLLHWRSSNSPPSTISRWVGQWNYTPLAIGPTQSSSYNGWVGRGAATSLCLLQRLVGQGFYNPPLMVVEWVVVLPKPSSFGGWVSKNAVTTLHLNYMVGATSRFNGWVGEDSYATLLL